MNLASIWGRGGGGPEHLQEWFMEKQWFMELAQVYQGQRWSRKPSLLAPFREISHPEHLLSS
jgi:hypothetical protein